MTDHFVEANKMQPGEIGTLRRGTPQALRGQLP